MKINISPLKNTHPMIFFSFNYPLPNYPLPEAIKGEGKRQYKHCVKLPTP
uniref:Uncharacterized protein n=1 Tax=Anguilla anguilla TaxID=7936 RepID=A0A0E9W869_ANGAN